jgi:hypothetical protein
MQKLLAILAACCALNAWAAQEAAQDAAPGSDADTREMTTAANVDAKRARLQSFEEAKRECTSRMYLRSPRGRSAPNWNVYDQCMKERGRAQG